MDCRLILEESLLIESDVMNIKTPVQILAAFQGSAFGVALVNHDNNQHGPNENLKLINLWEGIEIVARLVTMQ